MDLEHLLSELTVKEKCSLLVGLDEWHVASVKRLGMKPFMMADGPHGLRKQLEQEKGLFSMDSVPAVSYPTAVTLASTFNKELAYEVGESIAKECIHHQVNALLGPGLNIKRSPLCGRNFEYFSEDPLVSGEMAKAFSRGVESQNVAACLKHFALNNQESHRMVSSSVADLRTIREIYTRGFEIALEAKPGMVMSSYNRLDGVYASEHPWLLKTLLRDTFHYEGVIVSDWTAVSNRVHSLLATLDLEMPGHIDGVQALVNAIQTKVLSEADLDDSLKRMITLTETYQGKEDTFDVSSSRLKAKEVALEGAVLLKNETILPLQPNQKIAIIGALADKPRYQGAGSSRVHPIQLESFVSMHPELPYAKGYELEEDGFNERLQKEAVGVAQQVDVVLCFVGLTDLYESEGYDRTHLDLPLGHTRLIEAITAVQPNVVIILQMGSPIVMPWMSKVKGILNLYLGGEALFSALDDLLYGRVSPSGRLAETFVHDLSDHPAMKTFAKGNHEVAYTEGIYVGYRYFVSANQPVLFPFGYGLSYSSFHYENLQISNPMFYPGKEIEVRVDITNQGVVSAKETILLFVENPQEPIFRPKRELRQFQKMELKPQETKTVSFILTNQDFAYFNTVINQFDVIDGTYHIQICKDANTVLLATPIQLKTKHTPTYDPAKTSLPSYLWDQLTFEDQDFEQLIGRKRNPTQVKRTRPFTLDDTLGDIQHTFFGKMMKKQVYQMIAGQNTNQDPLVLEMIRCSILETPLRSMAMFSKGQIRFYHLQALLDCINWRYFKAIKCLIRRKI